ncbi:csm1-like protein [Staphylotrichum longicolle]|uniref:Csm1-like protein n=1 Tax=Staphylotrichum longicolle TaxID=669026 RepID=A0AAD4F2U3_9PEZI|nr:csm1-like protein [Staphylotrichum longicolle]
MATAEQYTKKRKVQDDDKPRKKQKKQKKVREDEDDLDMEAGLNRAFERMDGQLLADHIAQKTRRFGTDLSPVELSDLYISANNIRDSTSWNKPRSTENLPDFLEAFKGDAEKLDQAPKKCGSPHTIIVAGAGLRAADLVRSQFAKHFKVEEQVSFLKKSRTGIAVGTPQRLIDLIENEALSLDSLKRIVVDASHIDQKKRGIVDMRETMLPLAKLLCREALKQRYEDDTAKHIDLIFY